MDELSTEVLYEMCSLAGMDTGELSLKHGTIYPTQVSMVDRLLQYRGVRAADLDFTTPLTLSQDFNERANERWVKSR